MVLDMALEVAVCAPATGGDMAASCGQLNSLQAGSKNK